MFFSVQLAFVCFLLSYFILEDAKITFSYIAAEDTGHW